MCRGFALTTFLLVKKGHSLLNVFPVSNTTSATVLLCGGLGASGPGGGCPVPCCCPAQSAVTVCGREAVAAAWGAHADRSSGRGTGITGGFQSSWTQLCLCACLPNSSVDLRTVSFLSTWGTALHGRRSESRFRGSASAFGMDQSRCWGACALSGDSGGWRTRVPRARGFSWPGRKWAQGRPCRPCGCFPLGSAEAPSRSGGPRGTCDPSSPAGGAGKRVLISLPS